MANFIRVFSFFFLLCKKKREKFWTEICISNEKSCYPKIKGICQITVLNIAHIS